MSAAHRIAIIAMLSGAVPLALPGCISIKFITVGQKSAYERQLAGTYDELDQELALVASVRQANLGEPAPEGAPDVRAKALGARRRQLFNQDDLDELKRQGCLAENHTGQLETHECQTSAPEAVAKRLERMVGEENQDRQAIIDLALLLDTALTPADRPALQKVYAELMLRRSPAGTWVQSDGDAWTQLK
jgi:hypothetical protein